MLNMAKRLRDMMSADSRNIFQNFGSIIVVGKNRIWAQINIFSLLWVTTIVAVLYRQKYLLFCVIEPFICGSNHRKISRIQIHNCSFYFLSGILIYLKEPRWILSFLMNCLDVIAFGVKYSGMKCRSVSWRSWPSRFLRKNGLMNKSRNVSLLNLVIGTLFGMIFMAAHYFIFKVKL